MLELFSADRVRCFGWRRVVLFALMQSMLQPICSAQAFSDPDWNISFYDNCGLPSWNSVQWISEGHDRFIRIKLSHNDIGLCKSDRIRRHRASHWERAELKQQGSLDRNQAYELTFSTRFMEGFVGDRETFFQIHAYKGGSCNASPPIMMKITGKKILLAALRKHKGSERRGHDIHLAADSIEKLYGKWIKFKLVFDTSKNSKVTIYQDGRMIFKNVGFWIQSCGSPHLKFGIYRPGSKLNLHRSVIDFDDFELEAVDN
jgi:hypothetical protein